jgi:protein farnesyltransferase/geranylgeranyltransferase type-1 subunit alpha
MTKYSTDPQWSDVVPLPTDEGGPNPLAAIAYSPEYEEAMSYLRAVMAANEYSDRVLDLTEHIIDLNPAHYTVWLYRASTLFALKADLREELEWISDTARAHQKNYQIWNHRMMVVGELGDPEGEREFVEEMFGLDGKNYHVWSYRQWLVRRFGLWGEGEFGFVEKMLEGDVRNNSAWNYRWFLVNGREDEGVKGITDDEVKQREIEFATRAVGKAPQNPSPWNYLRGISKASGDNLKELKGLATQYADTTKPDGVRSSHALDLLADILADEDKQQAGQVLDLLAITYDPIRKNYWEYRKGLLGLESAPAAAA